MQSKFPYLTNASLPQKALVIIEEHNRPMTVYQIADAMISKEPGIIHAKRCKKDIVISLANALAANTRAKKAVLKRSMVNGVYEYEMNENSKNTTII